MSAYDDVFALMISTMTAKDWEDAKARLNRLRAEDGELAEAYRNLAEDISKTMVDPDRWDGDEAEGAVLARYVEWLAAERNHVVAKVLPAWEAMYDSATFTPYLIGYCNDEAPAKAAAETWFRSQCETEDRLEWVPEPQMADDHYDVRIDLVRIDAEDGMTLSTDIVVRHRRTEPTTEQQ